MIEMQTEFPEFPASAPGHPEETVADRFERLNEELGPLVPQHLLRSALGVSRQRVHQFLAQGRFTIVDVAGTQFVPVDEIKQFERHQPWGIRKNVA